MATNNLSQTEADCTCPVCCDIFKDPVVLLCGHSFCAYCLQEWWRQSAQRTCPVCMAVFHMAQPPRNLALRNLSDTLRREKRSQRATAESKELCALHGERFKLFCRHDQQLVCVVCRDAQRHKKHNCVPIGEAVEEHKAKLRVRLMHLKSKLGSFNKQKVECDKMANHIEVQAKQTEKTIREEFQKLYQFLKDEEAARTKELRKEAAMKTQVVNIRAVNLDTEISALTGKIKTIERKMKADDFSFMLNVKSTLEQSQCNLPEPQIPSGALIDEAKYVGNLQFSVWKKMKTVIQYTPVFVDPTTSGSTLILSKNLTNLSENGTDQPLPNNPEREARYAVLGYQGFSSGKHSWDVNVDGFWAAGVATRTKHPTMARIWGIYAYGPGDILFELITDKCIDSISRYSLPKKVRVELDYDQGLLSFSDLDRKTPIHTIKHTFTDTVFPYFRATVKILPAEVSLKIRQSR